MFLAEQPIGGGALRVVVHRCPGLLQRQRNVRLGHAEHRVVGERVVLDEDVHQRVDGIGAALLRDLRQRLSLQRQQLLIRNDGDEDGLGAGHLLPLVLP
jgi:hypothetical protein